jgi:alpha,alpha-trehalose phosphorylase
MIRHSAFAVEPWTLREAALDLDVLAQSESLFALANGHLGLRGNLDEGEPFGMPGTYLNSVFELRPIPYGETAYGFPESGQTVINVTNGKLIRLLVDDEPFDVRYGRLRAHQRVLDLRAGTLTREAEWVSPAGQAVRVRSVRMVSLTQRAVAAIRYEVEVLDSAARVVVQSELVANEPLARGMGTPDPRQAAVVEAPLRPEEHGCDGLAAELIHHTATSGLRVAAAMDHFVDGPKGTETECLSGPDLGRLTVNTRLEPGQRLILVKLLAYGWSSQRSAEALRAQVAAALSAARRTGCDGLLAEQRQYLDDFWQDADIELDGDPELQQAVRFGVFHILQAGARGDDRPIAAKGLTGPGYDGHTFWDTETCVLPILTYLLPSAAASALRWRHSILPAARDRARQLGKRGAAFPWRTIDGREASGYWPGSTAAFHINADIADAVLKYHDATGDEAFEREAGLELLVETARLWCSLGHYDRQGQFRIDGVTGPDEYSALADNNVYTNLMAQQNLRAAADCASRHPARARALGVDDAEIAEWRRAAEVMRIPYDPDLGVHPQADGFTEHEEWDFAHTRRDQYPLLLHFHYFDLYRKQVVKQPDLVLAMAQREDAFTPQQKARNFAYYERLTVRDSSLAAATQAVIAAEVGHTELAYDYARETALIDLHDLERNTRDGVHLAALAGARIALIQGFAGMRARDGRLAFAPRLPAGLTRLGFRVRYRDWRLKLAVAPTSVSYTLLDGPTIRLTHHGEALTLTPSESCDRSIPECVPMTLPPSQPPGREPRRRTLSRLPSRTRHAT